MFKRSGSFASCKAPSSDRRCRPLNALDPTEKRLIGFRSRLNTTGYLSRLDNLSSLPVNLKPLFSSATSLPPNHDVAVHPSFARWKMIDRYLRAYTKLFAPPPPKTKSLSRVWRGFFFYATVWYSLRKIYTLLRRKTGMKIILFFLTSLAAINILHTKFYLPFSSTPTYFRP